MKMENTNIATCEEYVVKRLMEVDKALYSAHALIDEQSKKLDNQREIIETIIKGFNTETTGEGEKYIYYCNVWEKYDTEQYNNLINLIKEFRNSQQSVDE